MSRLLADMTAWEMKTELRRRKAQISGTKPELRERLSKLLADAGIDPQTHRFPNPLAPQRPVPVVLDPNQQGFNAEPILRCPVCFNSVRPPIYQCSNGHLICNICRRRVPQCPTCRGRPATVRNLALEQILDQLWLQCPNQGCTERFHLRDKDIHEANCQFKLG